MTDYNAKFDSARQNQVAFVAYLTNLQIILIMRGKEKMRKLPAAAADLRNSSGPKAFNRVLGPRFSAYGYVFPYLAVIIRRIYPLWLSIYRQTPICAEVVAIAIIFFHSRGEFDG